MMVLLQHDTDRFLWVQECQESELYVGKLNEVGSISRWAIICVHVKSDVSLRQHKIYYIIVKRYK